MTGGVYGRGHAGETATAADGTHRTGMHSCEIFIYSTLSRNLVSDKTFHFRMPNQNW